tara:strand:- start:2254 stop:3459 length:1206 start_codon:yes stop_codon:yes gene_type:complete
MIDRDQFFKNYFSNSKQFKNNLKKTKKIYKSFLKDLSNNEIPSLEPFDKNYEFDFSKETINKFSKYKNIIIVGMGGSILGIKSICSFLSKKIRKKVFFFDNLDLNIILKYKKIKNLNQSCFIIISKSGNTLETISNLGAIFKKNLFKNRLIVITELANNALASIANKCNAEIIEHKPYIGGRYSVLSETGMFPSALMGLNILEFKNLSKIIKNKNFVNSLIYNVAGIYTLNSKGINNSIILNYDSDLNDLGYWYQQLVAESLGKEGKGINPFLSLAPKDHHSLLQLYLDGPKDKFFTFLNSSKQSYKFKISSIVPNSMKFLKNKELQSIIDKQNYATKNIFKKNGIPFREISFGKKNEKKLGEIFTFFVLETLLLARLLKVNPFDQPAVEQVKIETKKILS